MKNPKKREGPDAPLVTDAQIAALQAKLAAVPREPVRPAGAVSRCPNCGGQMITSNELERTIATPGLVYIVTRLSGAECSACGSSELDGRSAALLAQTARQGLWADYETAVTHSSGTTLGTYFKMDLARVLQLSGTEKLLWKVVNRDSALVYVDRNRDSSRLNEEDRSPRGLATETETHRHRRRRVVARR
jgi:YgiT-type zinc finger domain-containing protein